MTEKPLIRVLLLLPGYPAISAWIPPTLKGLESVVSLGADDPGNATAKQLDDRIWLLWNQDANFLVFRPNRKIGKTIIPGAACIVETDEETRPISMAERQFALSHFSMLTRNWFHHRVCGTTIKRSWKSLFVAE